MQNSKCVFTATALILASGPSSIRVAAALASGKIVVVDENTAMVGGRHLRLIGFETPEIALFSDKPTRTPRAKLHGQISSGLAREGETEATAQLRKGHT